MHKITIVDLPGKEEPRCIVFFQRDKQCKRDGLKELSLQFY
jgi:hypothetical protein